MTTRALHGRHGSFQLRDGERSSRRRPDPARDSSSRSTDRCPGCAGTQLLHLSQVDASSKTMARCRGPNVSPMEDAVIAPDRRAIQDPIYQGELNMAVKAVGHDVTRQCEGCHSPDGMVTGEIKGPGIAGLSRWPWPASPATSAIGERRHPLADPFTRSRERFTNPQPRASTTDGWRQTDQARAGKPDPECGGGFHECVESGLHLQADLCASCHQVYHYESHFPIEATYNEWKHGPYAQKSILCQDCHMVDIETFKRRPTASSSRRRNTGTISTARTTCYLPCRRCGKKGGDQNLPNLMNSTTWRWSDSNRGRLEIPRLS